jgi:hypothetical protein
VSTNEAAIRDALLAAGGCVHTINPYLPCDTCNRPVMGGLPADGAVVAYGFVAQTLDGQTITKADAPSVDHLPLEQVKSLIVLTSDPRTPRVTLVVDPKKGERVYRFRRNCARVAAGTGNVQGKLAVEVLEVRNAEGFALRLYLHPFQGPILSTQDLYF